MLKKFLWFISAFLLVTNLNAKNISLSECTELGENFIFAGGECIQISTFKGENEGKLIIVVHGTWPDGTNTLGRYTPFAETLNMNTDATVVAVALPGYSGSSTNNFTALAHEGIKNLAAREEYVRFLGELVKALKEKYEAEIVTYVGHSAGAMMGATLTGIEPDLINNIVLVGGRYDIHEKVNDKSLISIVDVMDKVNKEIKFVLIYGTADEISKPEVTTKFYDRAKAEGFDVKLVKVEGAPHLDLDMTNKSIEAITKLLEE